MKESLMSDNQILDTDDVFITASSELVESSSKEFVWGYYFCIENKSDEKITLIGKDWNITDENGNHFVDHSEGFSGEIPEIEPGEYFEFSALAPLKAARAVFYGSCKIVKEGKKLASSIKLPILQFDAGVEVSAVLN